MTSLHPSNPYYKPVSLVEQDTSVDLLTALYDEQHFTSPPLQPLRSQSIATTTPSYSPSQPISPAPQRQTSVDYQRPQKPAGLRTRSIGGPWAGVYFERDIDTSPPNDEEIIIATVRVTDSFRRASIEENAALPTRPPRRSFLKRVSTRVSSPTDSCRYTALKMPRKDYKRYFARDREGKYAGTDPEREWAEDELQKMFGRFQDMPLRSIPGGQEFGEGVKQSGNEVDGALNGSDVNRNDSMMDGPIAEGDLGWAKSGSGFDNGANERNNTAVVWPGSIWT